VHVVFDRYDIDKSLKTRTRNRRQGKEGACCKYDVTDTTQFNMPLNHFLRNSENKEGACCKYDVTDMTQMNMPLNRFLSNSENKDQLTTYLAKKVLHFYRESTKSVVVATKDGAASNGPRVDHLQATKKRQIHS